jgi:acyl dehydratase
VRALTAESFGPAALNVTSEGVAAFVAATGDDPTRWQSLAPPGFAAAGLLAVASPLLEASMAEFPAVVHTRQRFEWEGSLAVGSSVEVVGEVVSARERGAVTVVEFVASAPGWMRSTSSFLMSSTIGEAVEEMTEPLPAESSATAAPTPQHAPEPGAALEPLAKSASRLDIVRYAAASGDWNPIHWDHAAAVAAGLGGVIAHGLLTASWLAQFAAGYSSRPDPVAMLDVRFRRPLRPAAPAIIGGSVAKMAPLTLELSLAVGDSVLVAATAEVNE